jgi:hypothetical protein
MASAFLERYHKDSNEFLNHIVQVTGDEIWVSFVNGETKEQSKVWMHTHSPSEPKKSLKKHLPARKLMATFSETGQERSADGGIYATRDHSNIRSVLQNAKKTA